MDIHDTLVRSKKFMAGIELLLENKPTPLILLKACEELSELNTKLLQRVTKGAHTSEEILEEIVDVQMHLFMLERLYNFEQRKQPVLDKVTKMLTSKDFQKYKNK
jgi:hypothetical protein